MSELIWILQKFKQKKPEEGTVVQRKAKFLWVFKRLKKLYGLDTKLKFCMRDSTGEYYDGRHSVYFHSLDTIILVGKLDIITLLHEIGHALGKDEKGAILFSSEYEKI